MRRAEPLRSAIVDCIGEGRSRGQAHGESIRARVRDAVERWETAVGEATGRRSIDHYVSTFLGTTSIAATAQKIAPDLFDEVLGIAEGAGLREETVLAYNLMDEEWWF